jgi:hypothetical protein
MADFKKLLSLFEARKTDDPDYQYTDDDKKSSVTVRVSDKASTKYTNLAKNMVKIDKLKEELDKIADDVKQSRREDVAELFDDIDACKTRIIETKSAVFKMSKDPKPTERVSYNAVLTELEQHLTPELILVMKGLIKKHTSKSEPSAPKLSYSIKDLKEGSSDSYNDLKSWEDAVMRDWPDAEIVSHPPSAKGTIKSYAMLKTDGLVDKTKTVGHHTEWDDGDAEGYVKSPNTAVTESAEVESGLAKVDASLAKIKKYLSML